MDNKDSRQTIDKTIADYNLIAAKFSSTRHNITTDLQKLADLIPEDAKILDYGCGNGRMASLFSPAQYLGVDPSSELIKYAKKLHPDHKFRLIVAGERVDEKFDAVLCLAVIHHLPDHASQLELLNNLRHALNSGGTLILTSWNVATTSTDEGKVLEIPFKYEKGEIIRRVYAFSLAELEQLVREVGFTILSSKIQPRNRGVYSNLEIIANVAENQVN